MTRLHNGILIADDPLSSENESGGGSNIAGGLSWGRDVDIFGFRVPFLGAVLFFLLSLFWFGLKGVLLLVAASLIITRCGQRSRAPRAPAARGCSNVKTIGDLPPALQTSG